MRSSLAHITDAGASSLLWLGALLLIAAALMVENHLVAGPRSSGASRRRRRQLGGSAVVVLAVSGLLVPATTAQSGGGALPDLISDPPNPSSFNELTLDDGTTRLVLTFDGYVHNIGEGALEVVGNPQIADGMQQRVRSGDEWENVGSPTVRYETDDGHNHFHLIEAIEYVLWNEQQGAQTAIGSKIGFCLVDSEQMEPGIDEPAYSEELDNFCDENDPGSTDLRMGISPGWRDTYDATTTLQWVDVSEVTPGRYWIGAITDPNDEIAESDEENNKLIFSERTVAVPGFAPRLQAPVRAEVAEVAFELKTTAHGEVTRPIYRIESGPSSGRLDVPVGVDFNSPRVTYFPEPGSTGTDQVVFSVRDAGSPYPYDPPTQSIDFALDVPADASPPVDAVDPPTLHAPSTFFETTVGERTSVVFEAFEGDGEPARLFARGLPAGLTLNALDQSVEGVALQPGIFEVEILAASAFADQVVSQRVSWIVNASDSVGGLSQMTDRSSPLGDATRTRVGTSGLGLIFEASGLPPGLSVDETAPVISGSPSEAGTYEVSVRQLDNDGEIITESKFTWTIRPTTAISFAL